MEQQPIEHAPPDVATAEPCDVEPPCVLWLRLVRGESLQSVWMLPAAAAPAAAAVGAAAACDWRIEAAGVPAAAFSLQSIAGRLFVRASGAAEVRVDGHGLGSMWTPVEHGARIAVGEALIEVGLSGRSRRAQSVLLGRAFHAAELGELSWRPRRSAAQVAPAARPPALPPAGEPAAPAPAAALEAPRPVRIPGWSAPAHTDQLWSATIFGSEELAGTERADGEGDRAVAHWHGTSLWIAGSVLACAYGCWVLLLDHL